MIEINTENLKELMTSKKPLVIDFWADWCTPCHAITPMMNEFAREYEKRANIGKCNVEDNDDLAVKFKIRSIPTILFIRNGEIVDTIVGAVSRDIIHSKIKQLV